VEQEPAFSLTAARLPGVAIRPLRLEEADIPEVEAGPDRWAQVLGRVPGLDSSPGGVAACQIEHLLLLPDPFSFDVARFLDGLNRHGPRGTTFGGLASGGRPPRKNALFLGQHAYREGAVGAVLSGALAVDTIVAQGCRPIGSPMFVTRADGTALFEVDGQPVQEVLSDLLAAASPADRWLFRHSLFLGLVMSEGGERYGQGDFLVRNVHGLDRETGGLQVGAVLRERQVVQFHLRDAATSTQDLADHLERYVETSDRGAVQGGLLFSCLGRGQGLYGEPDHDSKMLREHLGDIPLGGFFCNGEIGPVQGVTHLHGYTSAFALFRGNRGAPEGS
jgi:small ligand-binding sensory domain FIST